MEIDIVAESDDGGALLFGEASWAENPDTAALLHALHRKAKNFPHVENRKVLFGLWLKTGGRRVLDAEVMTPARVLRCLR